MPHQLYPSLEALLDPRTFSQIEGRLVSLVECKPFRPQDNRSGSRFIAIKTDGADGQPYILKQISPEWDWLMRAIEDYQGREVLAWQTGLLAQLPTTITTPIIACAKAETGWAILMRDVSHALIPAGDEVISAADNAFLLDTMASLHATFWDKTALVNPALGFGTLRHCYSAMTPATGQREAGNSDLVPSTLLAGWQALQTAVAPDVAELLNHLAEQPQLLSKALGHYPQTVIHGDWKLGNLGIVPEKLPKIILLDWTFVTAAPPAVDLAWYIGINAARLPITKEQAIEIYRYSLAQRLGDKFAAGWWQPQLELALLGGCLLLAWSKALGAQQGATTAIRAQEQADLEWWAEQARRGKCWL